MRATYYLLFISTVISMSCHTGSSAWPESPNHSNGGTRKFRFRGVDVAGPFDVVINVNNKTAGVRVEPDNKVEMSVDRDRILQIKLKDSAKAASHQRIKVFIDNPKLESITSRDSSFIRVIGTAKGLHLDIYSYESSHIVTDVFNDCQCNRVNIDIRAQNSSVIDISGSVFSADIVAEGSSRINGARLQGGTVQAYLRDSSQVEISTDDYVGGNVNNHAILRVKGRPSRKAMNLHDSGRVEYENH